MRSFYARGVALTLLVGLASHASAQDLGMPSLLPLPPLPANYAVTQTAATESLVFGGMQSPVQNPLPAPIPAQTQAPYQAPHQAPTQAPAAMSGDFYDAMKGGYDGSAAPACSSCGGGCGCGSYLYANALVMTLYRSGGTVTSIDGTTLGQRINFCNEEFNGFWNGGFELGGGFCFGCNCNMAAELVYWGLYPSTVTRLENGGLYSMIDFTSLDYDNDNVQDLYDDANTHQVQYDFQFHSVEANLVGNGCNGGPFGCGRFGCNPCGSRWGYGWVAGLRYINFRDNFLFSSDPVGYYINGDDFEVNYLMQYNNNLFGFQVGGGVSYNLTDCLSAYATGKFGVFNNHVTGLQQVYGTLGNATINNGPFDGDEFVVNSSDNVLAAAGQFDLGGLWRVGNHWSINFGYRVMALSGVATADTNLKTANFHDVEGIASQDAFGSVLLHGAYVGAVFGW